jgi:Tol biopolymer transport system component
MSDPPSPDSTPSFEGPSDDRLDSWKEIAAYMRRDVTTVQRWEKREAMPVRRHVHDRLGSVYAFKSDLDAWARSRSLALVAETAPAGPRPAEERPAGEAGIVGDVKRDLQSVDGTSAQAAAAPGTLRRPQVLWALAAAGAVLVAALTIRQLRQSDPTRENPLAVARFVQLTDFGGIEQAAAVSRDGRFAAFLSDRDGQMDVWVTQVGTGQFHNLTRGGERELVNPSVRTLGFSPDGTLVTFWTRRPTGANQANIGIWAAPVLGGQPRPYLDGAAEFHWSGDGARLVYHTPGPGDPMYVRDSGSTSDARQIFSAPPGLHSHFLVWSPDQAFIYFVQGALPDKMDIWRIRPTGGTPERITNHDSLVSHPVFLNVRTLLYLASDSDGSGPWIHSLDVDRRIPRRVSFGIDRYTSLAASADGQRLVATVASPKGTLWRLPITPTRADTSSAHRIPLTTGNGSSPRLGTGSLLYVSSKGATDSIWKLQGNRATELWSAPDTRIIGGPAIARADGRIAFSVRQNGQTVLYVVDADGTNARIITRSLELRGAPAWTPDGQAITVAVVVDGIPRLFNVPLDGRSTTPLVQEYSVDPVWSPDGDVVVFSGADIGTTFEVKAVKADGSAYRLPKVTLTRGARHLSFMPGRLLLVVLRGEIRHKDLWLIDLVTGAERQLTDLAPDFDVRDFAISPDGRDIVLEQVQEHSDIVLLEVPRR